MEDYSNSREDEGCPQLLDLIEKGGEWVGERAVERSHGISEEKKLELRLAPPGGEWSYEESNTTNTTTISLSRPLSSKYSLETSISMAAPPNFISPSCQKGILTAL